MNDFELNDLLKSARVPETSAEYWEKFPRHVMEQIEIRQHQSADTTVRILSPWGEGRVRGNALADYFPLLRRGLSALRQNPALGFGLAVACVALISAIRLSHNHQAIAQSNAQQLEEAKKYYRELESLFPNQIEAIVLDQSGPRLVLANDATMPNSPPLYLKICSPDGCQRFITFSGQQIRVNGEAYDVLMDRQGHVLLVGRNTIWSDSTPTGKASNLRIEAAPLRTTT